MVSTRDKRINDNIGLVHAVAKRFTGRGIEYDDLFQAGCVGLIKAVDNFDEERCFQFSTYAVPVIMGEIKRLFRDGGAIKVSRALKEKAIRVQAVRDKFTKTHLREPTLKELSELSEFSTEELSEILNVIYPVVSINSFYEADNDEFDIPIDESDELFDKLSVDEMMKALNEKERRLIYLRYFLGKTQSETSKYLGVSQVQISRKEKAILRKLRELLIC